MAKYKEKINNPPISYDLIAFVSGKARETIRSYKNGRGKDTVGISRIESDLNRAIISVQRNTMKRLTKGEGKK
jgi:hypothetical protein